MMQSSPANHLVDEGISVLIVEDQDSMRSQLHHQLRQSGFDNVFTAESATLAVKMLADEESLSPDVIVSDLVMEGFDGMEFVHTLRRANNHTPVVIVTDERCQLVHEVVEQVGANEVLTMPISANQLAQAVHRVVGGV